MSAARGDSRPCIHSGCAGTMRFGREPLTRTTAAPAADGERGWVCSEHREHFHAGGVTSPARGAAAHADWDDDGGTTAAESANRP